MPLTLTTPAGVQIARTVIWFSVRVPVLSVQMTVVPPRVSTAGSRRMTARRLAIRETPMARVIVTAAGKPSGIAPTARAMAAVNVSTASWRRNRPAAKVRAARPRIAMVRISLNRASLAVSGVASTSAAPTRR